MIFYTRINRLPLVIVSNIFYLCYVTGELFLNLTNDSLSDCDRIIENAALDIDGQSARVICLGDSDVDGPDRIECINGQWVPEPRCIPRCADPPKIDNGNFTIDESKSPDGKYYKGTLAVYSCHEGYLLSPTESKLRVCEKSIWTGAPGRCVLKSSHYNQINACSRPTDVRNGYFVYERNDLIDPFGVGQRLHYGCKEGYVLEGISVQLCLENGLWSPKIQPFCWKPRMDPIQDLPCGSSPYVPHSSFLVIEGKKTEDSAIPGTVIEIKCLPVPVIRNFERHMVDLCPPTRLTCSGGKWNGIPPVCQDLNNLNSFMVSMATGAGVLSLLLVICLLVLLRRKRQLARALSVPPAEQRQEMGDHAILLHQPDRLALIAFADGMQEQRNIPPTYDEATRDRVPTYASAVRLQRPHWQPISSRRNRNSPNPDLVHIGRHGSFVSHTPSTRSAGDSMGSTDTMAISENSTNVTLDTASSYSGSQAPSCRAHCGSLASFDTGSVIITDDVPLLEENEIEDSPVCDAISLVLENPSLSDGASHKLSSAELT